ncbi:MAG: hypothetical protein ACLVJB_00345 [Christensenellales bacterium]
MAGQNRSASRKQSGKIAFCGMMVALSVALMLTGGLIPIATYCAPMMGVLLPIFRIWKKDCMDGLSGNRIDCAHSRY